MKKLNFRLLILIGVLIMSVPQMWAGDWTANKVVYLDNYNAQDGTEPLFGTSPYLRVGHTTYNNAYLMTKVPHTKNLYKYKIPSWGGYAAYAIANNCSWTGDKNSIYLVDPDGTDYDITRSTVYVGDNISTDRTIWVTTHKNKDGNCDYYNIQNNGGLTKYTIGRSASNGTIQVKYASDGAGTLSNAAAAASGDVSVVRSGNLKIFPTASSGYALTALSVGSTSLNKDNKVTSADSDGDNNYYSFEGVRAAATITATFTAIANKTIKIKDTDGWGGIKVYMWNDITGAENASWPGVAATSYNGSSKWYTVTLSSEYTHFIISRTGYTGTKSNDIPISSATAGYCYTTTTGDLPAATPCADAPTVSTNDISTYNLTSATIGGNITNDGSDVVSEYGYYYSTNSTLSSANAASVGTKVTVGTDDKDGSFSKSQTGLSMGTTYYVIAFATNPHGTGWGTKKSFTTTAATLTLTPTVNYEGNSVSISTSTNLDGSHGFSGTKYLYCSCTSKPAGAAAPTISYSSTTINISEASTDGQYIFAVSYRNASGGGGSAYVAKNCTIQMKTIPDYSSLTPTTSIIGTSYMNGSGTSADPYFVYSSHFNDAKTLTLNISGVGSSDAVYCKVGSGSEQSMTGSGTSRTATITLPSSSVGASKTTTVTVYAKVDGQTADAKKASKTVYYTVSSDPVVTVTATYNGAEVGTQVPQSATIVLSASVTGIPGASTFTYNKGNGAYSAETSYVLNEAGGTTVALHAKTSYLGDWIGTKNITTFTANSVNYVTSKTDMYGDETTTTTSRLFSSSGEELTAVEYAGYTFTGWSCNNSYVQVSDNSGSTWKSTSTNTTVYVKATSAGGTLTASYTENKRIYFDDRNTGWGQVSVYLFNNNVWHSDYGVQPKVSIIEYAEMTRIGESNVYYYEYTCSSSAIKYVAFSKHYQPNNDYLYATKGAYRGDFSDCNPVYVPNTDKDQTKNSVDYFNNGYWRRYMPQKSPYSLYFVTAPSTGDQGKFEPEHLGVDEENFVKEMLLTGNYTYYFNLPSSCGGTYGNNGEMTKDNHTNWTFEKTSDKIGNCRLTTTATGTYKFYLSTANGVVKLTVEYPLSQGDYQVYYSDGTGNNNNYSNFIRKNTSGSAKKDTVSFFVKKANSPTYQIKRCTGFDGSNNPTWENVGSATNISVTKDSVYNLIFQQNGDGTTISNVGQEYYSGNYYIRTDGAPGGWANYLSNPENKLKHTDKASALAAGYNYYFVKWIGDADGNSNANVKFCIATDYNDCVSQEHGNDPSDGSLSGGQKLTGKGANVRFTYHPGTNTTTRTCVGGSGHDDQYLVINGTNLKTSAGGDWTGRTKMTDLNDWIYTFELKAADDATISLESHYNDKYVTILPSEKVLDVSDANYYNLRIIYDFKTNEVVAAYIPSTVSTDLTVDVDIMFIRQARDNFENAPTTTLTLSGGARIKGADKTLYGAIQFEKNYVRAEGTYAGLATKRPQRSTYWISFPFDVRIKDVFGLGDYTEAWIIQRYRGDLRAQKGWFLDTKTFWEYVMDENYVMEAGQGYILSIDCEAIQWPNNQTTQYLYFPSKNKVSTISQVLPSASMSVPEYPCTITTPADRRIQDSHWNVIGIPGFADAWGKATGDVSVIGGNLKYFYTWAPATNTLSTASTRKYNFKFMHSYMVQYHGTINWSASEPAAVAARRYSNAIPEEVEFSLSLLQGNNEADHAFVTLLDNDKVTTGFDMNMDLVKMFNAKTANIYTIVNNDVQTAANCLPMTEQTTVVPVGVQILTDGEYTFAMPDGTSGVGVTLIDTETGIRTSLSALNYSVNLEAGTYNDRFVLEISPIKQTPSEIELSEIGDQQSDIRKVMIDGLLYIVRDGKMYDARGARVE